MNPVVMVLVASLVLPGDDSGGLEARPDQGRSGVTISKSEHSRPSRPRASRPSAKPRKAPRPAASAPAPTTDPQYPDQTVCARDQPNDVIRCHIADEPDPSTPSTRTPPQPKVTPGRILSEVKHIGLAKGTVSVQPPNGETLVNLPTILSTQSTALNRTITLLGTPVLIEATPVSYHWNHGDGTTQTTSTPGRPYPAKDITHTYLKKADHVDISVDITYQVRYRTGNGPWTTLTTTIRTTGPATSIKVTEAVPVLIAP